MIEALGSIPSTEKEKKSQKDCFRKTLVDWRHGSSDRVLSSSSSTTKKTKNKNKKKNSRRYKNAHTNLAINKNTKSNNSNVQW
jgi:hypothetical protein